MKRSRGRAKVDMACDQCKQTIHAGHWAVVEKRVVHPPGTAGCSPLPIPTAVNADNARLEALVQLETALKATAKQHGVTPELEKHWDRYKKFKELSLGAGTKAEGKAAMKMALIEMVKAVF